MIEEDGFVVSTESGFAWIETQRQSACGACVARAGCGAGVLAGILGRRRTLVKALDPLGACAGEHVTVGLEERALVAGSLAVYLLPLIALILGAGIVAAVSPERDLAAAAGGGAGLIASFCWLKWFANRVNADPRFQPIVLRRLRGLPIVNLPVEALSRPGVCE